MLLSGGTPTDNGAVIFDGSIVIPLRGIMFQYFEVLAKRNIILRCRRLPREYLLLFGIIRPRSIIEGTYHRYVGYLKVWLDGVLLLVIRTRRVVNNFALALHLVSAELLVSEGILLIQSIPSGVVVEFVSLYFW